MFKRVPGVLQHLFFSKHFCKLIQTINPHWKKSQCEQAAYQALTMIMGGWITLGETRVLREKQRSQTLKNQIVTGVLKLLED